MRPPRVSVVGVFLTCLLLAGVATGPSAGGRDYPETNPPPRASIGLAPDARGNVVMFGGIVDDGHGGNDYLGDTWTWDGTEWTEQSPSDAPSPRCCYGLAFDAAHREVVLFGGSDGSSFSDTWTWDGTTWTERHPVHSPPESCCDGMAYDAARGRIVLAISTGFASGVNTWTWDGTDWTEEDPARGPDPRDYPGMAYHGARRHVVLFGGEAGHPKFRFYRDDTWVYNGRDWRLERPLAHPARRNRTGLAYDPLRRLVVLFGGNNNAAGYLGDTWTWDGRDWTRLSPAESPLPREGAGMAWDRVRREVVLFGGRDAAGGGLRELGDTWTWDGSTWACAAGCRQG